MLASWIAWTVGVVGFMLGWILCALLSANKRPDCSGCLVQAQLEERKRAAERARKNRSEAQLRRWAANRSVRDTLASPIENYLEEQEVGEALETEEVVR